MSIRKNHVVLATATIAGAAAYVFGPSRETVANWFLGMIAVLGWVFMIAYGTRSNWRATAAGRGVMRLMLCLSVICTHGIATIATDYSYPGRDFIRPILLLAVALAVLDLLLTLIRIQRNGVNLAKERP
ncbi:putative phage holin [Nocardia otitidiscaviarum]|uniref:putative phage holin n=1 Tax=Nocardia otitidiscaviarum TaxID=1823 RepID=UPI000694E5A1|nr:hypothetical protein [Nocardia otitidiscaviarum]